MVDKKKRQPELIEESSIEKENLQSSFILEPAQIELGSGYTLAVNYDENEKPIVDIKTYGQVNMSHVREEIEKLFPNAEIRQLNHARSVTIVRSKTHAAKHERRSRRK